MAQGPLAEGGVTGAVDQKVTDTMDTIISHSLTGLENCYYCGEPYHLVRNCPFASPQPKLTLLMAPPVNSQMEN